MEDALTPWAGEAPRSYLAVFFLHLAVEPYNVVLSSRRSVENPDGCMMLDSEAVHDFRPRTRQLATSMHSSSANELLAQLSSFWHLRDRCLV